MVENQDKKDKFYDAISLWLQISQEQDYRISCIRNCHLPFGTSNNYFLSYSILNLLVPYMMIMWVVLNEI